MPLCFRIDDYELGAPAKLTIRANVHGRQVGLDRILERAFEGLRVVSSIDDPWEGWDFEAGWRTELTLTGRLPDELELCEFLDLLKSPFVTVNDELDESHCLDFHQLPTEIPHQFQSTPMGKLVYLAKYKGNGGALRQIVNEMSKFVRRHPRYAAAQCVTAVPGSISIGWRKIASTLAELLSADSAKQLVSLERVEPVTSQKDVADQTERYNRQKGTIQCRAIPSAKSVIIIDDMYGSGGSMQAAAEALRAVGAMEVLGLAATKTLKYTRGVSL